MTYEIRRESIASRHARMFDKTYNRSWFDGMGRIGASVLIIGTILTSLYFIAS